MGGGNFCGRCLPMAAFFFRSVSAINQGFVNLLQRGGNEDSGQGEEDEDLERDSEARGFADKWGWIDNVNLVSETCRCSWDDVWMMSAIEFLNILAYRKDKAEHEKEQIEKWKRRN